MEKMSSFRVGMVAGVMLWFSTKDIFAPQRTSGKVWRFFFFPLGDIFDCQDNRCVCVGGGSHKGGTIGM